MSQPSLADFAREYYGQELLPYQRELLNLFESGNKIVMMPPAYNVGAMRRQRQKAIAKAIADWKAANATTT
jgi:nitrate reductase assembly molybdenum cofactor insertion protein NarJ